VSQPSTVLLIGYGNPLRGDDGLGHRVIDALGEVLGPNTPVKMLKMLQLDVVLAGQLADQKLIVFVDAAANHAAAAPVSVVPLSVDPMPALSLASHALTPTALVALTHWLYGRSPRAALVAITGHDFSFGSTLSAAAEALIPEAVRAILAILAEFDPALIT
jgi:hydrogenase maturation protease